MIDKFIFPPTDPDGECVASNFGKNVSACSSGFIYAKDVYEETLSTRFNLVCDNEDKQKFLGTLMMSGLLIGSVVGGLSGDYFGRKKSLYAATLVIGVSIGTAT